MKRVIVLLGLAACGNDEHVAPLDAHVADDDALGPGDGCISDFVCPATVGSVSVCGRLWDIETDVPIALPAINPQMPCDPRNPSSDGPCSLSVRFYDAATFARSPTTAPVITPPAGVFVDGCGRYKAENLPRDQFDLLAVVVDDAAGNADLHRPTAVALEAPPDTTTSFRDSRAYTMRNSTDVAWSTPIFGSGATFAERGALAIAFTYHAAPVSGVQAQRNGAAIPDDDYYFRDVGVLRSMIDPAATSTGANGTVLVTNASLLAPYGGIGAEPSGCTWPSQPAITGPGILFVQRIEAIAAPDTPCP
jgi:hypothetical protein